jgi:hypothetical protein
MENISFIAEMAVQRQFRDASPVMDSIGEN